ncbi:MAG: energy transducer TonB [Prevotella sp.]|nr:energy transducer TonB [Prevotella sp.]
MQEAKKSPKANLERRRKEIFILSLLLALSIGYCVLEWCAARPADSDDASLDDIIEDIDFDLLRHDADLFAAVPEEQPAETSTTIVAADEEQACAQADDSADNGEDESETSEAEELISVDANSLERQVVLERLPEFPGGATAFMKWITANVKYPKSLQTKKIAGTVTVSFVVDTEGNATQLAVDTSGNKQLAQTVLTAMRRMPKWRPGIQNGKVCATMVKVPINFEL